MDASGIRTLRLPDPIRACLFDLDGVLTDTARVHAAAWKEMFDAYLSDRASRAGEQLGPFDLEHDYEDYVDGKPRFEGVRSFLAARGIHLPDGSPGDPPERETVSGLGNRKDELFLRMIRERGVEPYPGSLRFVHAVRDAGLRTAVVSSSAHCREVLEAAGIETMFEARIDGTVVEREHLRGKPAPDAYLAAARRLGVGHEHAAVFEDAIAGVEAGRAGRFGHVVGVDRSCHAQALREHVADVVVGDLAELISS
jgi:beta-phosphoglucomutase family hydrolase